MLRAILAIALCIPLLPGCSDDNCVANTGTYCDEGVSYWTDSCGKIGEIKEDCECGCRLDHTDCKRCECDCEQVNDCCDGCRAINEADECDDGDSGTEIDMCAGGACKGFALHRAVPELPAEPAAPAPVHLESWTCPAGWTSVAHATLTDAAGDPFSWCEPPPVPVIPRLKLGTYVTPLSPGEQDGDRAVCEPEVDGTFPMYGHADCQPLGDPCPAGDWPDIPAEVTGARIYVLAGSSGNGTQASPYGTITEAVGQAAAGDVVVIGAGTYPEMVAIDKNLTLWGKCVQQSIIDAPGPYVQYSDGAVMLSAGANVTIRNLQITGEQNGVRLNSNGANALLQGVWIHGATREGVSQSVMGGTVRLNGVLIDSMQALSDGSMGWGIGSREDCNVTIESSTIELARDVGAWLVANDTSIQDSLIRNTLERQVGRTAGRGIELQTGARLTASRALLDHNRDAGLAVLLGSSAELVDVVIFDTQAEQISADSGAGIVVAQQNASATLRRCQLIGNREYGALITGAGALLTLEEVLIADTQVNQRTGLFGNGIWAEDGPTVTGSRVLLDGNRNVGILAVSSGTSVDLDQAIIRSTVDDDADNIDIVGDGDGVMVEQAASVTLTNSLLEANHGTGAIARFTGTIMTLQNTAVLDTLSRVFDGRRGYCLDSIGGSRVEVYGGLFAGCQGTGIMATEPGSTLVLEDITVRDIVSEEGTRSNGVGLRVDSGAQAAVTRGSFERVRTLGIFILNPLTAVDLTDISISDTLPNEAENVFGRGLALEDGAQVTLTRGMISGNREAGIFLHGEGTLLEARDLTVKDTLSRTEIVEADPEAGLAVREGAKVVVTGGLFENNRTSGILASDQNTVAELDGVTVRDTISQEGLNVRGLGIWASLGAYVKCENSRFERNREVAVFAHGPGTRLDLERVVVKDTLSSELASIFGRGLNIQQGATGRMAYSLLDNNQSVGVYVHGTGSAVDLEEVVVANTRSREADRIHGHGFSVSAGGSAVIRSSVFYNNRDVNLYIHGQGTQVNMERVMIKDSLQRDCALVEPITCAGCQCGNGLGIYSDAAVIFDSVSVDTTAQAGVQLARMGTLNGNNLILRDNPIAVNIQDVPADYDFFEAVTNLLMEDNAVNFDSTALQVPDPADTLGIE